MTYKNVQDLIKNVELVDTVELVFKNNLNEEKIVSGEVTAYDDRFLNLTIEPYPDKVHSIEKIIRYLCMIKMMSIEKKNLLKQKLSSLF